MKITKSNLLYIVLLLAGICLLVMQGCEEDKAYKETGYKFNGSLAAPIAYGSYGIEDLLSINDTIDQYISSNENGRLYVSYTDDINTIEATGIIDLPDTDLTQLNVSSPGDAFPPGGEITIDSTMSVSMDVDASNQDEISLDSLILQEGSLNFNFESDFQHSITVDLTIPDFTRNGQPFNGSFTIEPAGAATPTTGMESFVLDGYSINLNSDNTFDINYQITISEEGNNPINADDELSLNPSMTDLVYDYVFGDIAIQPVDFGQDSISIDLFNNSFGGDITLNAPTITFKFVNSSGVPASLDFNEFSTINKNSGERTHISFNPGVLPFRVSGIPLAEYQNITQTDTSRFVVSEDNADNLDELIKAEPHYVFVDILSQTNPDGQASTNFVARESKMDLDVEIKINLGGSFNNWVIQDTLNFNGFSNDTIDYVDSVSFKVHAENYFPLNIDFQVYLADSAYNVSDSLFASGYRSILKASQLNDNGKTSEPGVSDVSIPITSSRVQHVNNAEYFLVKARINTPENQNVDLFENYRFDLKIGGKAYADTVIQF